mmetsp:Transcript_59608/g.105917  ORF Transcript_59608/g.105917 Transcript_59608/m.105917 type:complete len:328 (+) Transcript_59608:350-1333(+)
MSFLVSAIYLKKLSLALSSSSAVSAWSCAKSEMITSNMPTMARLLPWYGSSAAVSMAISMSLPSCSRTALPKLPSTSLALVTASCASSASAIVALFLAFSFSRSSVAFFNSTVEWDTDSLSSLRSSAISSISARLFSMRVLSSSTFADFVVRVCVLVTTSLSQCAFCPSSLFCSFCSLKSMSRIMSLILSNGLLWACLASSARLLLPVASALCWSSSRSCIRVSSACRAPRKCWLNAVPLPCFSCSSTVMCFCSTKDTSFSKIFLAASSASRSLPRVTWFLSYSTAFSIHSSRVSWILFADSDVAPSAICKSPFQPAMRLMSSSLAA